MSLRSLRSRVARLTKERPHQQLPWIDWHNLTCPLDDIRPDRSGTDWRELRTRKPQRVATDPTQEIIDRELGPIPEAVVPLRSDPETDSPLPPEEAEIVPPSASETGFPAGYEESYESHEYEPEPDQRDEYEPEPDEPQQETSDAD